MTDSIRDIHIGSKSDAPLTTCILGTRSDAIQLDPRTLPTPENLSESSTQKEFLILADNACTRAKFIVKAALKAGHKVTLVTQKPCIAFDDDVQYIVADRDSDGFESIVAPLLQTDNGQTRFKAVVDCAPQTPRHARQDIDVLSQKGTRLIFISNDLVYDPQRRDFPTTQACASYCTVQGSPWNELRQAEAEIIQSAPDSLEWTILRPTMLLDSPLALNDFPPFCNRLEALQQERAIPLPASGHWLVQPLGAEDFAQIVVALANSPEGLRTAIDCAGPVMLEFRQLCEISARLFGKTLHATELPEAEYLPSHQDYAPYLCHRIYSTEWPFTSLPKPQTSPDEALKKLLINF